MKGEEKQRKFHEALLKMLYPPPSPPSSPSLSLSHKEDEEEEEGYESEANLMKKSLNDLPEDEIENDDPSQSNSDDKDSGDDGKLTRAQRKRLRKRKLKEAASCRRKIVGPLLPDNIDDHNHGGVQDVSIVAGGVLQNAARDLEHGSVEVASNAERIFANNVSEEEASCSNKNKLKLKQRRKSKKVVVGKSTPSTTTNHNEDVKSVVDERVDP